MNKNQKPVYLDFTSKRSEITSSAVDKNQKPVYLFFQYTSPAVDPNYMDYTFIIKTLSDINKCKIHKDVINSFTHQVFIMAPIDVVEDIENKYSCNIKQFMTDFIKNKHEEL